MNPQACLIVGIGSRHGDDQAGWQVIDLLAESNFDSVAQLKKASVPHDLLDWMDGCNSLHIVDACDSGEDVQRYDHSISQASRACRAANSHQFDITRTLELAKSLDRLPPRITLWAIPGEQFEPHGEISGRCMKLVAVCAERIEAELDNQ